ncbi:MAG: transglutaminase-like domain-containing protein [Candidatus Hydrogenedentes bacterium]|nr:transglutaminase-like domain-containing protein [Candidatus Hydrogenedentota bacterium]
MIERSQLPHLVRLLDDESPGVRDQVLRELLAFGPALEDELRACDVELTPAQRGHLSNVLVHYRAMETRREAWRKWRTLPSPYAQLETAFEILGQIQYGWAPPVRLSDLLNDLAKEFLSTARPRDPISLSRFLFAAKQLQGNVDDYYHPLNSNLYHVIQEKRGLPISLACIFMLVGVRVGVTVFGCNLPGHFLARGVMNGANLYFDCFNGGRLLTANELNHLKSRLGPAVEHVLVEAPSSVDIMRRVLLNLVNAYEANSDPDMGQLMTDLLNELSDPAKS